MHTGASTLRVAVLPSFWYDLRASLRSLARVPLFATVLVGLIALGTGANTLVFTLIDVLLLRPLAVSQPEQLVRLGVQRSPSLTSWEHHYFYRQFLHDRGTVLRDAFAWSSLEMALAAGDHLESITGETVSGNYFRALGLSAESGRLLTDEDERAEARVAVLSHGFRQRLFGPHEALGATIRLRGHTFTVVGVLRAGFNGLDLENRPDVWIPMSAWKLWMRRLDKAPAQVWLRLNGPRARAEEELRSLYPAMVEANYAGVPLPIEVMRRDQSMHPVLASAGLGVSAMRKQFAGALSALMVAVAAVLLLVAVNAGGLMLARAEERQHEMAIRLSLGASRWSIGRLTAIEALIVSGVGAALGWLLAVWGAASLAGFVPARRPSGLQWTPDARVMLFAAAVCIATAVLASLLPVWRATCNPRLAGPRVGPGLVVFQVALATALVAAGLVLARTLDALRAQDPGFRRDRLIVLTVNPVMAGVPRDQLPRVFDDLVRRAAAIPGVESVSLAERALMRGVGFKGTMAVSATRVSVAEAFNTSMNYVDERYLTTMGIRLLAGRDLTIADAKRKPQPALVTQSFARHFFPGEDPIGRTFGGGAPGTVAGADNEIIGVVNDVKYRGMRETPPPTCYFPMSQDTARYSDGMALHLRVRDAGPVIASLRTMLRDMGLAPTDLATMEQEIETSLWQERLIVTLAIALAALAATVAAIGVFGMLAWEVARRTREIGIRVAVGATPAHVTRIIARYTVLALLPGAALGLAAYTSAAGALTALVYGVPPRDTASMVAAAGFAVLSGAVGAIVPAWRALRIEPMKALRD